MPVMLRFLNRVAALLLISSIGMACIAQAQVTITRTSSPVFYIDTGISPALTGSYASYQITTSNQSNVWVEITSFTGGAVSLASSEDGMVKLGTFTGTETKTAFFYLQGSASTLPQGHTVNVYDGPPSSGTLLGTQVFSITSVEETIKANANKVTTIVAGPNPPILGGIVTITVTGETGTIGAAQILSFTPATASDWPADDYQMVGSEITLSGGNSAVITDALYHVTANSPNTNYVAVYTFRAVGTTAAPTVVSPVAFISSGTQIKHTNTSDFATGVFDPVQSVNNQTILTKSAGTSALVDGGVVTYTITLTNNGPVDVELDDIVDTLPTTPATTTYVVNTAAYEGAAVEPTIAGNTLTWQGPFTVPAGGTADLIYDVTIPDVDGGYINSAIGHIGSDQIDTTADTNDSSPAIAAVAVDGTLPVELTSFDAVLDGNATLLTWTTASETNNAGFNIEHKVATADWQTLTWIDGHGTTEAAQNYGFRIDDLAPGRHTFRLKQIDYDGTFDYSPEVEVIVELAERFVMEAAYPNPFNPQATMRFAVNHSQAVEVSMYDMLGRRVQVLWSGEAEAGRMQEVRIDGSGLASGVYLVHVVGNGFAEIQRVTLVK